VEQSRKSHVVPVYSIANRLQYRYLQNGNILASHTFITHYTTTLLSRFPSYRSPSQPTSLPIGLPDAPRGEVTLTTDPVLNFCQLAVLTCQRAQGDRSKIVRESWVRLCGTYQSKGGVLASPEVRAVRFLYFIHFAFRTHDILHADRLCKSCLSYTSLFPHHAIKPQTHSGTCCLHYLGEANLGEADLGLLLGGC